jgi:hypothetical protein
MNEHDIILIQELTASYEKQFVWYIELRDLVQKILSRLILSRGNMSELMIGLGKKKKLLDFIEFERSRTTESVLRWQEIKKNIVVCEETAALNEILETTSIAIKEFLDEEEKLKRYLEGIVKKEASCQKQSSI